MPSRKSSGRELAPVPAGRHNKELESLYDLSSLLGRRDISRRERCALLAELVPQGMQYPEICQVRIRLGDETVASPGFLETQWMLSAEVGGEGDPLGAVQVAYMEKRPNCGEGPFLLEERKLVNFIAKGLSAAAPGMETPGEEAQEAQPEWKVILDLLRETDNMLWKRILRRLMNHLSKQGVPGVHGLIMQFDPANYAERDKELRGSNQALPKRGADILNRLFEDIIHVASIALPDRDITALIKRWILQDRLGLMAIATDQRDLSLVRIRDMVERFCRSTREGEVAISEADDRNARVALARRLLTERLTFIQVAKEFLSIHDFGRLLPRIFGPTEGNGKIGGKAAGMYLAHQILKERGKGDPLLEKVRMCRAWYITSDGLFDFVHYNSLEDTQSFKYSTLEEVREGYPYMEQIFKHSHFSPEMTNGLKFAMDELGDGPLIVRSSSLLEDSEGSAFSGKYRSLFLVNTGTKEERLAALLDAIAEVYASIMGPDPIQYRKERGLLDFMEEMGILIQRVVGTRVGRFFFPAFAGVAFSNNEFRWSPRIRREDGIIRMVTGLGTRAVDRVGEDYPTMIAPGQPGLRVNSTPDQALQYAQRYIDVLDLETGRFESPLISEVLEEAGDQFPLLDKIFSVYRDGMLRKPSSQVLDPAADELVVTFSGLVESTPFIKQMRTIMTTLEGAMGHPVDIEFASDGKDLFLLQCRPQSWAQDCQRVAIPTLIPHERKLFSASRYVSNAQVSGIRYAVYIDPLEYGNLPTKADMTAVGAVVSRLNGILPRRSFILLGPGRWGSRGDITLGVPVTYSDINNTAMLVEVARRKGGYTPDLSFGTHFFQDLVEANIKYLALYPDEEGAVFNERFFKTSPSILPELLPDFAQLQSVVRVVDVEAIQPGMEVQILMDGEKNEALAFLREVRPQGSGARTTYDSAPKD
jgi:pyruvate, water dikinase